MTELRNIKVTAIGSVTGQGIDSSTQALETVNYEHHEIHGGGHFFVAGFETLASGASAQFQVTTPDTTKWLHMSFEIGGTSQTEMYIYEGAVGSGVVITPFNNNRNASTTSDAIIWKNGSLSVPGTLIYAQSKGMGGATPSKANTAGVTSSNNKELILKSGTTYNFNIMSADADNVVTYYGGWYEHTDKVQKF